MPTLQLPNGTTITGTTAEISEIINNSELIGAYYKSESKGTWVKISEMNTQHLKNALVKKLKEILDETKYDKDAKGLLTLLQNGVGSNDLTVLSLLKELRTRRD